VEELEHKAVAFDVFQQVDGRYSMRMLGMVFAALLLGGFWMAGFVALLLQCTPEERARIWRERLEATDDDVLRNVFLKGLSEYFRTDFHPNRKNTDHLLEKFFRRSKLTPPQPASASAGSSQAA
jgi:predicted metal-dependent hydrolase